MKTELVRTRGRMIDGKIVWEYESFPIEPKRRKRKCATCKIRRATNKGKDCPACYYRKTKPRNRCDLCFKIRPTIDDRCIPCRNSTLSSNPSSYRAVLFRDGRERVCENWDCKLQEAGVKVPYKLLDVDHIDCDRKNNAVENLQYLCVWCHALKTRFKTLNLDMILSGKLSPDLE